MIDTTHVGTPGWWFRRLLERLADRRAGYQTLEDYYTGNAGLPALASKAAREAYRRLMLLAVTNYAELIVEAVRERMQVVGFRTGADDNELGDAEAWRIWQANSLDADSGLLHRAMLTMGAGYVIVGGVDPDIEVPLITPEDPREVIAEYDPVQRRKTIAALKVYCDEADHTEWAILYLPGVVYRLARPMPATGSTYSLTVDDKWEFYEGADLPLGVVPVVGFQNRAALWHAPMGEFEPHLSLLNRINYTILSRLEIATLQAFRQRAVKGVPVNDPDGNPIDYNDIFAADPGALWLMPGTAELWESQQVDLGPLRMAIRDDVMDLAAVTRTPLYYLTPDAANGSAEGASLAREGLVFKTQDRITQTGESWEQVMSLAFRFAGDEQRARRTDMEALWASPERFGLAQRFDAASKAQAAGVPWRTVMSDVLQFSPQQVERMDAERATDTFLLPPATAPQAAPGATQPAPAGA